LLWGDDVTDAETQALVQLIIRECEMNREQVKGLSTSNERMIASLIASNERMAGKLIDVMVDRRLCKLDAAQEALTEGDKPKFSVELCQAVANRRDWCGTHNRSIWECVKEMTERLS